MIVMSVDPVGHTVSMVSIPRDMVDVPLPDGRTYRGKINSLASYARHHPRQFPGYDGTGSDVLMDALGALLKIELDYYATVNLGGFVNVIDTLGGIDVNVERSFCDPTYTEYGYNNGFSINKGRRHLNGYQALAYARVRHPAGESDFTRAARQQEVLSGVRDRIVGGKFLNDPLGLVRASARRSRRTCRASDLPEFVDLAVEIDRKSTYRTVIKYPLVRGAYDERGSIQVPNVKEIRKLSKRLFTTAGETPDKEFKVGGGTKAGRGSTAGIGSCAGAAKPKPRSTPKPTPKPTQKPTPKPTPTDPPPTPDPTPTDPPPPPDPTPTDPPPTPADADKPTSRTAEGPRRTGWYVRVTDIRSRYRHREPRRTRPARCVIHARDHQRPARRRPNARSRLIAAAVVASLLAAFAVTAPASALPTCRIGDDADQAPQVHGLAPLAARHALQAPEHVRAVRADEHELRRTDQRLLRPHDHRRGPQGDGVRGAFGRRPARRAVGLPELLEPEGHVRLLGSRRRLRDRDQGECPRGAQRAPARNHARLPELQRVGALELQRLGYDQGGCLAEGQRLEVRLHHVVSEGQVRRDVLRVRTVALPLRGSGHGREGPREQAHAARVPVEAADRATADAHADAHEPNSAAFANTAAYPEPTPTPTPTPDPTPTPTPDPAPAEAGARRAGACSGPARGAISGASRSCQQRSGLVLGEADRARPGSKAFLTTEFQSGTSDPRRCRETAVIGPLALADDEHDSYLAGTASCHAGGHRRSSGRRDA